MKRRGEALFNKKNTWPAFSKETPMEFKNYNKNYN